MHKSRGCWEQVFRSLCVEMGNALNQIFIFVWPTNDAKVFRNAYSGGREKETWSDYESLKRRGISKKETYTPPPNSSLSLFLFFVSAHEDLGSSHLASFFPNRRINVCVREPPLSQLVTFTTHLMERNNNCIIPQPNRSHHPPAPTPLHCFSSNHFIWLKCAITNTSKQSWFILVFHYFQAQFND